MKIDMKGVTRIVFVFKTVVVKIPNFTCQWDHFLKGILSNICETKTWRYNSGAYEKGTSHLLCPVLYASWGGWFIVMRRASTISPEAWANNFCDLIYFHTKAFPGDDTYSNYGFLDGRLVKIDYGSLHPHTDAPFVEQIEKPIVI